MNTDVDTTFKKSREAQPRETEANFLRSMQQLRRTTKGVEHQTKTEAFSEEGTQWDPPRYWEVRIGISAWESKRESRGRQLPFLQKFVTHGQKNSRLYEASVYEPHSRCGKTIRFPVLSHQNSGSVRKTRVKYASVLRNELLSCNLCSWLDLYECSCASRGAKPFNELFNCLN